MSELSEKLAELDVKIESVHVRLDETTQPKWPHDLWLCTVSYQGRSEQFDYHTGVGNRTRKPLSSIRREGNRWWDTYRHCYYTNIEVCRVGLLRPTAPTVADVCYCLLSDAEACVSTFEEWCGTFGYDTDSRKALDTYMACQSNGAKLQRVLGAALVEQLRTLEH